MLFKKPILVTIFNTFNKEIEALKKKHSGIRLEIKWVPGRKGVEGNEQADSVASAITVSSQGGSADCEAVVKEHYEPVSTEGGSVDCEAVVKEK
jgi:hypothetical protein